jgi:hypothetical protein
VRVREAFPDTDRRGNDCGNCRAGVIAPIEAANQASRPAVVATAAALDCHEGCPSTMAHTIVLTAASIAIPTATEGVAQAVFASKAEFGDVIWSKVGAQRE